MKAMEGPWVHGMPTMLSEQDAYIDDALTRFTATYRAAMLATDTTESAFVAEYLVAHADEVLDLKARARTLKGDEVDVWLAKIRDRMSSIVYMRRPK